MDEKLATSLAEIKHRNLALPRDNNPHRPHLSVWAELEADGPRVVVCLAAMFGQPTRWVEMSTEEASSLASLLESTVADILEVKNDLSNI